MSEFDSTMHNDFGKDLENPVRGIIRVVCDAMEEKGYDPVNQLIGYIVSGDPTYITAYKNARSLIAAVDKDEILEELVNYYISGLNDKNE